MKKILWFAAGLIIGGLSTAVYITYQFLEVGAFPLWVMRVWDIAF